MKAIVEPLKKIGTKKSTNSPLFGFLDLHKNYAANDKKIRFTKKELKNS